MPMGNLKIGGQLEVSSNKNPRKEDYRVSKQKVGYKRSDSADERCGKCWFFKHPGHCRKVEGNINPDFVCDLFE